MDKKKLDIISAGVKMSSDYMKEAERVEKTNPQRAVRLREKAFGINEYLEFIQDIAAL